MPTDPQEPEAGEPIGSDLQRNDPALAGIVAQFVERLPSRLDAMERALEHSDFEALRQTAHQLKGSGGGYGYPKLSEKAATLERYARSQALHDCTRALDDLRNLCARIMSAED